MFEDFVLMALQKEFVRYTKENVKIQIITIFCGGGGKEKGMGLVIDFYCNTIFSSNNKNTFFKEVKLSVSLMNFLILKEF